MKLKNGAELIFRGESAFIINGNKESQLPENQAIVIGAYTYVYAVFAGHTPSTLQARNYGLVRTSLRHDVRVYKGATDSFVNKTETFSREFSEFPYLEVDGFTSNIQSQVD